jgi:thioredoxin-like negative regulator of GroEL
MTQAARKDRASYPQVYRHLMTVGLLGSIYRTHEDANTVGAAVEATLSDTRQFRMYRALAQGIGGDATFAAEMLGAEIEHDPDNDGAKVAMAVAMMLAGDPEWKPIIDKVLATSTDQAAREAAVSVLNYLTSLMKH